MTLVESTLLFEVLDQSKSGRAVFDLVPHPWDVQLDGVPCEAELAKMPGSFLRRLSVEATPGSTHRLSLKHTIDHAVEIRDGSVELRFAMDDLEPRAMLERYLPCNLDFDVHDITVEIVLRGVGDDHLLFSSGEVHEVAFHEWRVEGKQFRNSSLFLHLVPADRVLVRRGTWAGKETICYADRTGVRDWTGEGAGARLERFEGRVHAALDRAQAAFGDYPHQRLVAHLRDLSSSSISMEYHGVIEADEGTAEHEIVHQWFGRSAYPETVQDSWIDEAIATWFTSGQPEMNPFEIGGGAERALADQVPHGRQTPREAYGVGERVIAALAHLWRAEHHTPLRDELRKLHAKHRWDTAIPLTSRALESALGGVPGAGQVFARYVNGNPIIPKEGGDWLALYEAFLLHRDTPLDDAVPFRKGVMFRLLRLLDEADPFSKRFGRSPPRSQAEFERAIEPHERVPFKVAAGSSGRSGAQPLGDGTWVTTGYSNGVRRNWGVNFPYHAGNVLEWAYGEVHEGMASGATYEWWENHQQPWLRDSAPETVVPPDRAHAEQRVRALWSSAKARHGFVGPLWLYFRISASSDPTPESPPHVVIP